MSELNTLIDKINNLLPQTQCGLCSYNGCRPYAKAIAVKGERINRCPPGGLTTLNALANLLAIDPQPFAAEVANHAKPPMQAKIREDECIGCTKCIQACPVDAIMGSTKLMHTILQTECTGCELCVAPCPVDCIDMIQLPEPSYETMMAKQRYDARQQRLTQAKQAKNTQQLATQTAIVPTVDTRQAAIQAALARFKQKKAR